MHHDYLQRVRRIYFTHRHSDVLIIPVLISETMISKVHTMRQANVLRLKHRVSLHTDQLKCSYAQRLT
jgi:hypothetical protein